MMIERISGIAGTRHVDATDGTVTGIFDSFYLLEDSVIETLTGTTESEAAYNFLTACGLSGKTLKPGAPFLIPGNYAITAIKFTSGSAFVYTKSKN